MDEENQTYTIDDYIADGIDKIYETINNVDVKLDDNFNDLKEEIDKLNTEVNNLVTSLRETTIVTDEVRNTGIKGAIHCGKVKAVETTERVITID